MDEAIEVAPRNGSGIYKIFDLKTRVRLVDSMNDGQDLVNVAIILKMEQSI